MPRPRPWGILPRSWPRSRTLLPQSLSRSRNLLPWSQHWLLQCFPKSRSWIWGKEWDREGKGRGGREGNGKVRGCQTHSLPKQKFWLGLVLGDWNLLSTLLQFNCLGFNVVFMLLITSMALGVKILETEGVGKGGRKGKGMSCSPQYLNSTP